MVFANSDVPEPFGRPDRPRCDSIVDSENLYEVGPAPPELPRAGRLTGAWHSRRRRATIAVVQIGMTMPVMEPDLDATDPRDVGTDHRRRTVLVAVLG